MKAIVLTGVLMLVLAGTVFAAVGPDGRELCPPPEWCPAGDVRYVPWRGEYAYTDGSAEAGGDPLHVTWDRTGPMIDDLCISTGRGMLYWSGKLVPPQHGWYENYTARICEVVITTE